MKRLLLKSAKHFELVIFDIKNILKMTLSLFVSQGTVKYQNIIKGARDKANL